MTSIDARGRVLEGPNVTGEPTSILTSLEDSIPSVPFLHVIPRFSAMRGIEVRMVRDDLIPVLGGGNKVRKVLAHVRAVATEQTDAVITAGGLGSNHCRVTAGLAAMMGWKCHLVLHNGVRPKGHISGENVRLMDWWGATYEVVQPQDIGSSISRAAAAFAERGEVLQVIPGGAHSQWGMEAYAAAVAALEPQLRAWTPDYCLVVCGTGGTLAGLVKGFQDMALTTHVLGISVARRSSEAGSAVSELLEPTGSKTGLAYPIDVRDDWVGNGYGIPTGESWAAVDELARSDGILLDPIYTGKAFGALCDMIGTGEVPLGSRVLFWHTGGQFNLLDSLRLRAKGPRA